MAKDSASRRFLPWLAVGLFILFIFSNSLWTGEASGQMSGGISLFLYRFIEWLRIPMTFETFHLVIRKGAHMAEYLVLAILTCYAARKTIADAVKRVIPVAGIMLAVPLLDEGLQLLVPGRAGMLTDCLIDMGGYVIGLLIAGLVYLCKLLSYKRK